MLEELDEVRMTTIEQSEFKELSDSELEYVQECVVPPNPEALVQRIDELQDNHMPPKAIDNNPQIAEIIEPMRDSIPSEYLEAPSDMEQVELISNVMIDCEALRFEEWKNLSIEERVGLLNDLEGKIAKIEHRPACSIQIEYLGSITENYGCLQGHMGYHQKTFGGTERIVINSELVRSDNPLFYREVLDTVVHEGRHSYQTFNLEQRETHTSKGDLTNWHTNLEQYGYQNAQLFGFKAYWMQPVEADARKFAEDVLNAYNKKL